MAEQDDRGRVRDYLLNLYGGDPFKSVYEASNTHREDHARTLAGGAQECGVYPSEAVKMRVLATLVQAASAKRILEIGCRLGYSALWLAEAAGPNGTVDTIDRFPEHAELAHGFAVDFGAQEQVSVLLGEADAILPSLQGQYDLIHDDGWFGHQPGYYEGVVRLLRPGGLWILSNWFLLDQAITGNSTMDWSEFAGPRWADDVKSYADILTSDTRLYVSYIMQPSWVALACKRR